MSRNRRRARKIVLHGLVTPEDDIFGDGYFEVSLVTDEDDKFGLVAEDLVEDLHDLTWEQVTVWGRLEYSHFGPVLRVDRVEVDGRGEDYDDSCWSDIPSEETSHFRHL